MLGLLYKDFLVMKKEIITNVICILACSVLMFIPWGNILEKHDAAAGLISGESVAFVFMPLISYLIIFSIISGLQDSVFSHDENRCYSSFITATPVTAKGQVLSKYYEVLFLSFCGVVWGNICDTVSSVAVGNVGSAMTIYVTLFFVQIMFRAIEIPFIIRYGQKYGRNAKILMLSVIVFASIVYLLFGKLPAINSDSVFDAILNWFLNEKNLSNFTLGIVSLFPYVSILLYYLSYRISCKMYQKGVASYE